MIIKTKNFLVFLINDIKNFLYQKLKYSRDYLYVANSDDINIHKKNFYENEIRSRVKKTLKDTFPIELNKLTFDNSINLNDPINPLVLTANELNLNPNIKLEDSSLFKFFLNHKPKNLREVFFLKELDTKIKNNSILVNKNQFTLFYPWLHKYPQRFLVPGMFGPKDISFPKLRFIRLRNLIYLIKKYGFKPTTNDQISGYLLSMRDDYRFVITAGTHRASVLKSMFEIENKFIDVSYDKLRINKNFFKIRLEDIDLWPGVKSGYIKKNEAEELFKSFFKFKIMNS